ncbi:MAG TPA: hypothetical protein DIW26_02985 [Ruminococcus sp.]|nr:hypothetical protein [Ruminococcus sp.]
MKSKLIIISVLAVCICSGGFLTAGMMKDSEPVNADNIESEAVVTSAEIQKDNIKSAVTTAEIQKNEDISIKTIDKTYVLDHMLNSIDYFDTADGEFVTNLFETAQETDVIFSVNVSDSNNFAYEKCTSDEISTETFFADGVINDYDNINKIHSASSAGISNSLSMPASARISKNEAGENVYYYRDNKMNLGCTSQCLMSQELTFGCLADESLWEISGEEKYLGYDCIVIDGTAAENYGNKLGMEKFKFLVEKNTGIVMNFEGYDSEGNIAIYSTVKNISIDDEMSFSKSQLEAKFNSDEYAEY